jgi:O-antigen biosynthesis protein
MDLDKYYITREAKKLYIKLKDYGIRGAADLGKNFIKRRLGLEKQDYYRWIKQNEKFDLNAQKKASLQMPYRPFFSIIIPTWNVDKKWLEICIDSIKAQSYDNWEICISDDDSPIEKTKEYLKELEKEPKIKVFYSKERGQISVNTNRAAKLASGDFYILVDNDDELSPNAFYEFAKLINEKPETDYIFSDEDRMDVNGIRYAPYFKPDFALHTLITTHYCSHLKCIRSSIWKKLGGLQKGTEGAQDWDLLLRVSEITDKIYHIPKIFYHWRSIETSTSANISNKPYAIEKWRNVLNDYCKRNKLNAEALPGDWPGVMRLEFKKDLSKESLDVFVVTQDGRESDKMHLNSLESFLEPTKYNISYVTLENLDSEIKKGKSENILITTNKITYSKDISPLFDVLSYPKAGVIGALTSKNGLILNSGYVLGVKKGIGTLFYNETTDVQSMNRLIRNVSAVSKDLMLLTRETYNAVGNIYNGYSELYDIDFCLRAEKAGKLMTYCPYVELEFSKADYYLETYSEEELNRLQREFPDRFKNDPYYNINLSKDDMRFTF